MSDAVRKSKGATIFIIAVIGVLFLLVSSMLYVAVLAAGIADNGHVSAEDAQKSSNVMALPETQPNSAFFVNREIIAKASGGYSRCTVAFVAKKNGKRLAVTAGHCLHGATEVSDLNDSKVQKSVSIMSPLGVLVDHTDYALFDTYMNNVVSVDKVNSVARATEAESFTVDDVVEPIMGMNICAYGVSSGWRCGTITDVGDTFFIVDGMKSSQGDSGGGAYSGNSVIGITSATLDHTKTVFQRADVIMKREGLILAD